MPLGNDPETGMLFGMFTLNWGARAASAGVASSRLKPNWPKSVEFCAPVTMLPEGVPGVMVIPFGNAPETGMVFGMLTEN